MDDDDTILTQFRPRSTLARILQEKMIQDQYLRRVDKNEWYRCDMTSFPLGLAQKFVQLNMDEDTINFLINSERQSEWIFTQVWRMLVKAILGLFMSQTSINGWLQCGSMFVISQNHLYKLLGIAAEKGIKYNSLLDLGAGDGKVTAKLAPLFEKVYVTEASNVMQNLLQNQGYQVLDINNWHLDRQFDVISCLNLIDRCDKPLDMLENIRLSVKPDGFALLAVVLPFCAFVESGPDHTPKQILSIEGTTFEQQVNSLVNQVLIPAGFQIIAWSRVPYLCEGNLHQSYYWLDDVIIVLKTIKPS